MATVIESMTGVRIQSPFFGDPKTLELFPDISQNGTSHKRNRVALLYGTNGSGKSTLAQGFREYVESTIPRTVDVIPLSGTNQLKLSPDGKPDRIHVFDEVYISNNIKLQRDGLGSIVLFGRQIQIEKRIKEIEADLLSLADKIERQDEVCKKYLGTHNVASPAYWSARIIKILQGSGGWAETDGIRIKKHQIKSRVTETEIRRLGQLSPAKNREEIKAEFEKLISIYEKINSSSNPISPAISAINVPYDVLSTIKIQLGKKPKSTPLSVREQGLLDLMGISTLVNAKGFLSVSSNSVCPQCLQPIPAQHRSEMLVLLDKILNREIEDYQNSLRRMIIPMISDTQYDSYSSVDAVLVEKIKRHIHLANAAIGEHNNAVMTKIEEPMEDVDYGDRHRVGDVLLERKRLITTRLSSHPSL